MKNQPSSPESFEPPKQHNPDNLSPEQVGVADGWRLLDEDEITTAIKRGVQVTVAGEVWSPTSQRWVRSQIFANDDELTYRTLSSREELAIARGLKPKPLVPAPGELCTKEQWEYAKSIGQEFEVEWITKGYENDSGSWELLSDYGTNFLDQCANPNFLFRRALEPNQKGGAQQTASPKPYDNELCICGHARGHHWPDHRGCSGCGCKGFKEPRFDPLPDAAQGSEPSASAKLKYIRWECACGLNGSEYPRAGTTPPKATCIHFHGCDSCDPSGQDSYIYLGADGKELSIEVVEKALGIEREAPASAELKPCSTCDGAGLIGGHSGQTAETYEEHTEACPDCTVRPEWTLRQLLRSEGGRQVLFLGWHPSEGLLFSGQTVGAHSEAGKIYHSFDWRYFHALDRRADSAEVERLKEEARTDGPVFNRGRQEGQSDIVAKIRAILDPADSEHWNIDGLLTRVDTLRAEVERLNARLHATADQLEEVINERNAALWEASAARPWVLFYRDGKTLAEVASICGGTIYSYSPWLMAPLLHGSRVAKEVLAERDAALKRAEEAEKKVSEAWNSGFSSAYGHSGHISEDREACWYQFRKRLNSK